ncbi:mediator of RNA polymerase II transcription subunit 14 [Sodiomyces alkalinus F11]|uniref:Mediator of RNA polymerase II transcription subunit 14 n=1 Tax=Sodiomyces alkalinus (strain CBS 110278 / VKM F-3762 / F11) TaxID=1314773 RepID=A0A3N2PLS2_SODAK|nr:mediator of RNA polymerase II transcription subunit 14 [Sodiomyces alkalinus F11]ROT35467.1 mediator of RNA polymerase II transcription subunit 14 [Sodiomyces alkalinus F11]
MENGAHNGGRSDHDRDHKANGRLSGGRESSNPPTDKGKAVDSASGSTLNGAKDGSTQPPKPKGNSDGLQGTVASNRSRMNDLPDEIVHITQGFIPLSTILVRLAQSTHDDLQKAIMDAASVKWMPVTMNGNAANGSDLPDDTSEGNRKRKTTLLKFAQDAHTKWVKALVITDWSRKAATVSKLIDLKAHLDGKRMLFDMTLNQLIELKLSLNQAKLPSPDLKTALQILTTGEAPWIPEPGYIPPPALTPEEQLKWVEELNTLLSLRLNLEDYDKIPPQFKDYTIESGRVTFKVRGEFEVDLTIADEDFEKQFWFIDFRFDFSPSSEKLSDGLMTYLEAQVNDILGKDGLQGCYQFLHEFVLTHKVNELKRQAIELVRSSWAVHLKIEPLNRALALQYWTNRLPPHAPKSWVMVAVQSGKRKKNGELDPKYPSRLVARWYRDNQEVSDIELRLNMEVISAEELLKSAIANHVEHILSTIHEKLITAPRFVKHETFMRLKVSPTEPLESTLEVQLGGSHKVTLMIEPVTGLVALQPHTRYALQGENRLNHGVKDVAKDGVNVLENIRWGFVMDEINRRGRSAGWTLAKSPIGNEDVKRLIKARDGYHALFFQRQGLGPDWFVMLSMSLSGDEWVLVRVNRAAPVGSIRTSINLNFSKEQPSLDDAFWDTLTVYITGIISHAVELEGARDMGVRYLPSEDKRKSLPAQIKIPVILFNVADVLDPPRRISKRMNNGADTPCETNILPWAADTVEMHFRGVRRDLEDATRLGATVDAILHVKDKSKFQQLRGRIDRSVFFYPRAGQFLIRMRGSAGQPILQTLAGHIRSIDRLVKFINAIRFARTPVKCKDVSLHRIKFAYKDVVAPGQDGEPREWTAILDMARGARVRLVLEDGNPHTRILDLLTRMANNPNGIVVMIPFLADILPVLSAFDAMETRWEEVTSSGQGQVEIFARAADWHSVRYTITNGPDPSQGPRQIFIDLRTKGREGETFWFVSSRRRSTAPSSASDEEVSKILRPVWDSRGEGWRGLSTGAAARLGTGVMELLLALDDAVRAHAIGAAASGDGASTTGLPTQVSQTFSSQGSGTATQQTSPNASQTQPRQNQLFQRRKHVAANKSGGKNAPVMVLD